MNNKNIRSMIKNTIRNADKKHISQLCKEIGITEISSSQLNRRINKLPTEWVQKL